MCSLPFVVEAALRQRVSTESELIEARNTWGAIEGFVSIEPFSQAQYLDCNVLGQAVPEAFAPQRKFRPSVLVAPASAHKKTVAFWDGLTEHLGLNRVLSLAEAIPFKEAFASAYSTRGRGGCVLRCMWEESAAASLWALRLTCAKNGAVVSDDEPCLQMGGAAPPPIPPRFLSRASLLQSI